MKPLRLMKQRLDAAWSWYGSIFHKAPQRRFPYSEFMFIRNGSDDMRGLQTIKSEVLRDVMVMVDEVDKYTR